MPKLVRPSQRATKLSFRALQDTIPKDALASILKTSADPRIERLLIFLFAPALKGQTLAELAHKAGLTYGEVLRVITQAKLSEGLLRMSEHVPDVLEDTAVDAKSRDITCPECRGTGERVDDTAPTNAKGAKTTPTYVKCWTCGGTGKLRKAGDAGARSLVFEAIGLTGRKGAAVQVNIGQTGAGSVEDDVGEASRVLDQSPAVTP